MLPAILQAESTLYWKTALHAPSLEQRIELADDLGYHEEARASPWAAELNLACWDAAEY